MEFAFDADIVSHYDCDYRTDYNTYTVNGKTY